VGGYFSSERSTAIKLRYHAIASLGCSVLFYLIFKSFLYSVVCFLAGILVDLDHVIDYVRCTGWNLNIKYFFQFVYGIHYDRLTILFHAWEFSVLFVIMIMVTGGNLLVLAVGIGFIQHLIFDQCTNPIKPFAYFIIYRLRHKFSKESILSDDFLVSLPRD
jgi:hypothetical protein